MKDLKSDIEALEEDDKKIFRKQLSVISTDFVKKYMFKM
jgi:hypothetical protein